MQKLATYYDVDARYFLIGISHTSHNYIGENSKGIYNSVTYNEVSSEVIEKLLEENEKRIKAQFNSKQ